MSGTSHENGPLAFQNTLLNIGPTPHCNIGNCMFFRFVSVLKLAYFSDLLGFKYVIFVCK